MRQAVRRPHSAIDTTRELWSMANPFAAQLADALETSWPAIARPNQLPPPGDWQVWLLLAGRGFGKTRTLAEWVCQQAGSGQAGRIAVVAATARDVLVERIKRYSGGVAALVCTRISGI